PQPAPGPLKLLTGQSGPIFVAGRVRGAGRVRRPALRRPYRDVKEQCRLRTAWGSSRPSHLVDSVAQGSLMGTRVLHPTQFFSFTTSFFHSILSHTQSHST